jgi:hypothetical protein
MTLTSNLKIILASLYAVIVRSQAGTRIVAELFKITSVCGASAIVLSYLVVLVL